ncbi:hypothetical protein SDC9_44215 [bioreactor metagenome]|uniref:Uncharacterized protein n=1 Tax=bioreactor metagenome TaxID=1076179 RepID=A0A644W353_9ZZZZ
MGRDPSCLGTGKAYSAIPVLGQPGDDGAQGEAQGCKQQHEGDEEQEGDQPVEPGRGIARRSPAPQGNPENNQKRGNAEHEVACTEPVSDRMPPHAPHCAAAGAD